MKVLELIKKHKILVASSVVAVACVTGVAFTLNKAAQPVASVVDIPVSRAEAPKEAEKPKEVVDVVKSVVDAEKTEIATETSQNEEQTTPKAQTIRPTEPQRPDYLHPSIKEKLTEAEEDITWQCFTQAQSQIKSRNGGFDDVALIAQVSRNLYNPCGNENGVYRPDGRFIASYVEWCILKADGKPVPPSVSETVAQRMCAGF
jgi:hypothetical protein